jgi:alpha-mannosidase
MLHQVISLKRGSHRLEFATTIDWQESHRLLKVAFPINVHANEALHEIQFGYIKRPTHRSRQYDADRYEVCNHKWSALMDERHGAAVLNDSKYGLSIDGSTIKLTLLRSPGAPDPQADRGMQEFTYAIYPWVGPLTESHLIQEAYELNIPPLIIPGQAGEATLFSLDASNIILEIIKPAEDGTTDLILRLYEALHTSTKCCLSTSLPLLGAYQTDMLETNQSPLLVNNGKIALSFRPFEIKTLRLQLDSKESQSSL